MQPNEREGARPILVTGAGGFLGSALTRHLIDRGHGVIGLDRDFAAGRLDGCADVELIEGDVRDEALVRELVARSERVVHFAAVADVRRYSDDPLEVLEANLMGSRNVFMAAHEASTPVLFASSSEALGKNNLIMGEGSDAVFGPSRESRWAYGVSKLAAEHWAWALAKKGLVASGVRYFNVYGPLLDQPGSGRVISKFIGALQRGEDLLLVDGGDAIRCFCWIDDAVEATAQLLFEIGATSPLAGRVFNIGRPEPVSIKDLAARMIALSGGTASTRDVPGTDFFGDGFAEIPRRIPDVSELKLALGFQADTTLDTGLRRVMAHWDLLAEKPAQSPPAHIPMVRPRYGLDQTLLERIGHCLQTGKTTNGGEQVQSFERELAAWLDVEDVVTVSSGSAALLLSMHALGLRGSAIVPSFTYVATLNAVERAGLRPILCDVDPNTFTMSTDHLELLLEEHSDVTLVVPVSVFGVWPDMAVIEALASAHGATVVHDAAHAFGSSSGSARVAGDPAATTFSFHATKVLAAIEGGAVVPRSPELATELRCLRTHGLRADARASATGWNAKMDELSAATGRHALAQIDGILSRRRAYAAQIHSAAECTGAYTPQKAPEALASNVQNLALRSSIPLAQLIAALDAHGVGASRYFSPPLHHLERLRPQPPLPHTEALYAELVCVPLHSRMSEAEIERIGAALSAAAG